MKPLPTEFIKFHFQSEILFYEIPNVFGNFTLVTVPVDFAQVVDVFCEKNVNHMKAMHQLRENGNKICGN